MVMHWTDRSSAFRGFADELEIRYVTAKLNQSRHLPQVLLKSTPKIDRKERIPR